MLQSFVFALLATSALAVPTPIQHQKQHQHVPQNFTSGSSFKVASRPRPELLVNVDTAHEMKLLLAKYAVSDVAARGILSSLNKPAVDSAIVPPKIDLPSVGEIISDVASVVQGVVTELEPSSKKHKHTSAPATAVSVVLTTSSPSPSNPPVAYTSEEASSTLAISTWSSSSVVESSSAAPIETSSTEVASTSPETTAPATSAEPSSSYVEPSTSAPTPATSEPATSAPATSAPATSEPATSAPATTAESSSSLIEPTTAPAPTTEASSTPATTAAPTTESSTAPAPSTTLSSSYTPAFSFDPTTSEVPTSTSAIASSTSAKQAATVAANPEENDKEYLSPVTIGGQALNLDFDTGSADLWVFSTSQPSSQTAGHAVYDPSKSSTWSVLSGATWKILYGDGSSASGTVGLDTVTIGGATVPQQAVEIASTVAPAFVNDTNNDGLVGLGFSVKNTVSPQKQKTFFENIMDSLQQPVFTVDLRAAAASTYEFGVIDSSKYTGDIHYTGIDSSNGYWQFTSTSYAIAGTTYANTGSLPAIADTGTSILLMNDAVVGAYYNQVTGAVNDVNNAGGWTYPCSAKLPDFGVGIGDTGFIATVPGASMSYATLKDGVTCFGALQSNNGIGYQIFGDTLLKQYFAVFNGGAKTFGIATKA